jgi:imidazolonepropionase-like amidohydrolase
MMAVWRRKARCVGLLYLVILAAVVACAAADDIVVRAGHLIDPQKGSATERQSILIRDGKIVAVGSDLKAPAGAQVIDLSDEWVLPGLGDAHQHLTLDQPPAPPKGSVWEALRLTQSTAERTLRGLRNAQAMLAAGFTMVRDVGNAAEYGDTEVRRAIERGWYQGPAMLTAGKIITPFGGQDPGTAPERGTWWRDEYIDADTADQVRAAVRRNIYYGATVIKLAADSNAYHFTEDQVRAAVDEAHHAGLTVAVHVYGGEAARNVIAGGADSVEHGYELTDDLLDLMKQKGTYLVLTELPAKNAIAQFGDIGMSADTFHQRSLQRLQRAYKRGVKIAFGSDVAVEVEGRSRPDLVLEEPEQWQEAGLPPAFILRCMTSNVSELMRFDKIRGAIAPGLAADLIATPANPLENVSALRKVNFVMKDGKTVRDSLANQRR